MNKNGFFRKMDSNGEKLSASGGEVSKTERLTFSLHLLMTSAVKLGSCLRYESLDHMACVTI